MQRPPSSMPIAAAILFACVPEPYSAVEYPAGDPLQPLMEAGDFCNGVIPQVEASKEVDLANCNASFMMGACIRDDVWEGYELLQFTNGEGTVDCAMMRRTHGTEVTDPTCTDCARTFEVVEEPGVEWGTSFCVNLGVGGEPWNPTTYTLVELDRSWELLRLDVEDSTWTELGPVQARSYSGAFGVVYEW